MIRYPVPAGGLAALVDQHDATWAGRASQRAAAILSAGEFNETSSIWGGVKPVFMRLQHFKCAFCERPLSHAAVGSIEHDLEHFRPKGSVKLWPTGRGRNPGPSYAFSTGAADPGGYYWLAYELENYAASCKPCNSILKKDFFPVAQARGGRGSAVRALNRAEKPFLLYPISDLDDDPEDLIGFEGIVAVPLARSGHRRRRAQVTIDFFRLNEREELWHGRFHALRALWQAFELTQVHPKPARRAAAQRSIDEALEAAAPHASCARNFWKMIQSDPEQGWRTYEAAEAYIRR